MTHRDRAGGGLEKAFGRRRPRLAMPGHRRATRSWPKAFSKPSLWVIIRAPWYYHDAELCLRFFDLWVPNFRVS